MEGSFTVQKTKKVFSTISIDQAHRQTNAHIKGNGGAVGLTDNPSALQHWMVAGPEVARFIAEFQAGDEHWEKRVDTRHLDQSQCVKTFFQRCLLLCQHDRKANLLRKRVWIWLSLTLRKYQIFLQLNQFGMSKE